MDLASKLSAIGIEALLATSVLPALTNVGKSVSNHSYVTILLTCIPKDYSTLVQLVPERSEDASPTKRYFRLVINNTTVCMLRLYAQCETATLELRYHDEICPMCRARQQCPKSAQLIPAQWWNEQQHRVVLWVNAPTSGTYLFRIDVLFDAASDSWLTLPHASALYVSTTESSMPREEIRMLPLAEIVTATAGGEANAGSLVPQCPSPEPLSPSPDPAGTPGSKRKREGEDAAAPEGLSLLAPTEDLAAAPGSTLPTSPSITNAAAGFGLLTLLQAIEADNKPADLKQSAKAKSRMRTSPKTPRVQAGAPAVPPKSISPEGIEMRWSPKFFNEQLSYARVIADDENTGSKGENYEIFVQQQPQQGVTPPRVASVELMAVPSLTARERGYNPYALVDSLRHPSSESGVRMVEVDWMRVQGTIRFRVSRKKGTNGTPFKRDGELNLLKVLLGNGSMVLSPIFNVTTKRAGHKALDRKSVV